MRILLIVLSMSRFCLEYLKTNIVGVAVPKAGYIGAYFTILSQAAIFGIGSIKTHCYWCL